MDLQLDLEDMRKSVWASWFLKISTDENPQHGLCPRGDTSCWKYWVSDASGNEYHHKHSMPATVMETIKPIYRDLADKKLLSKCLHRCTQNPNSFNNSVWQRVPKTVFVGWTVLKMGVMDAVICFNDQQDKSNGQIRHPARKWYDSCSVCHRSSVTIWSWKGWGRHY